MSTNQEWKFLSRIYSILVDGNAFNDTINEPVVRFKYPDEIQKTINFSIDSTKPLTDKQIEELCKIVIKYSVKTGHPHFHNQLFAGVDPYGLAGSWITEALNTSQYTFEVGPVFTMTENAVLEKTLEMFGFENGDGIFTPGGSISNMYAMVLARYKTFPNIKSTGLFGVPPLVAFTSDDAHYSIKKSMHWLGIGTNNLILIKTDSYGRMVAEDLNEKINNVINDGRKPFFVNATAGTTVLGAFDDFRAISMICKKYGIWMHVDACLGGTVILSNTHKHLLSGSNHSNSISWNPHKTLGAPLQCSIFLVKEKGILHQCNSANAQYLFQQDKFYDVSYDTGDKSIQCGRKVDSFKIWLMFKARGLHVLENLIDNAMSCSAYLTNEIINRSGFRLVLDKFQYTNVCFWYIPRRLRNVEENVEWWKEIYQIPVKIKQKMVENGNMMIGYTPLPHKKLGNFFRMVTTCFPIQNIKNMDYILIEIERLGEEIE